MITYTVSKFDRTRVNRRCNGWLTMAWHVPARVAVQHIRELEGMGYDRQTGIFVQRDDWKPMPKVAKGPRLGRVEEFPLWGEQA